MDHKIEPQKSTVFKTMAIPGLRNFEIDTPANLSIQFLNMTSIFVLDQA